MGRDAPPESPPGSLEGCYRFNLSFRKRLASPELIQMREDEPPQPVQEARRALDPLVVPLQILFRRRREQLEQAAGVGAVLLADEVVGHHVALRLGHLGAVLDDHALAEQRHEGLVDLREAEVAEDLRVEPCIEEMEHGVLDTADVLVDRHPVVGRALLEHAGLVARRAITQEVPRRLHEGVHRVRLAPRRPPAPGTGGVDEAGDVRQRRAALAGELHVTRQRHREIFLGLGHHAAGVAVEHGDRRAPVALATDAPVAQAVVDLGGAEAARDQPVDGLALRGGDREAVEEAGVDLDALTGVGLAGPSVRTLDGLDDRQPVLLGEFPVALVLAGDRHDGAGAVAHQDVVGEEQRNRDGVERVHDPRGEAEPALGPIRRGPLDLRLPGDLGAEPRDGFALGRRGGDAVDERVLGGQHCVRHAEGGIRPRGEHADREIPVSIYREIELGALALADPVPLHGEHALRPAGQPVAPREQLLRVRGDLEEPPVDLAGRHLGIAAPAAAVLHLLVGQHRLTRRAPVHRRALPVRETALEHLDEYELLPLVVGRIAGRDLALPVVGDAHLLELRAHVVDVLVGPDDGMDPVLDRGVFGGQAERVPAHRVQHVESAHPLETCQEVADRVDADVAHVDPPRGVREHLQAVELGPARVLTNAELLGLLPDGLPLGLDLTEGVAIGRHN